MSTQPSPTSRDSDRLTLPRPDYGQRVSAFGDSGSGKTYLLREIFKSYEHGIAVDTKHDGELAGCGTLVRGDAVYDLGPGRFVWRPGDDFIFNEAEREKFFLWCLKAGWRCVYVDEYGDVVESAQGYPRGLRLDFLRGRSRHLTMMGTSQEPTRVPTFLFGQATHLFVFAVSYPTHQDLASQIYGEKIRWDLIPYGSHKFFYKGPHGRSGPWILKV